MRLRLQVIAIRHFTHPMILPYLASYGLSLARSRREGRTRIVAGVATCAVHGRYRLVDTSSLRASVRKIYAEPGVLIV